MKKVGLTLVVLMVLAATLSSNMNNKMVERTKVATAKHFEKQRAPFKLEVRYAENNVPAPLLEPFNVPWSSAVNVSSANSSNPDRDVHIAHGSDGSIWLSWDSNEAHYQAAIAKSDDDGATWDVRYYGHASYDFQYSCITINDAGYLRLWTTIIGGSYSNDIAWLQSAINWPNDIDSLDGWYIFNPTATERHDPEGTAWGGVDSISGEELIGWTNKTPDSGTDVDTVEIWWSDDWGHTGWSNVGLGNADDYNGMRPTVAVCVPADTFRMIAFETDSSGRYGVDFWRIDSINASVWFHGWSTYHFVGTRCPALTGEDVYSYIGYEIDDGSGGYDLLFNYSADAGDNWLASAFYLAQTTSDERHPRLTSVGARVGATYAYVGGANTTNRFNYSDAFGQEGTWGAEEIITDGTTTEDGVHCAAVMWYPANNKWYAAWSDTRTGATDVYSAYREAGNAQIITDPPTPDSFVYFNYGSKGFGTLSYITKYCERVYNPVLSEGVLEKMQKAGDDDLIGALITMKKQVSTDYLLAMAAPMKRQEAREFVWKELRKYADKTQKNLLAYLYEKQSEGNAARISSIFTGNRIGVRATKDVISEIAEMSGVGWITPEVPVSLLNDTRMDAAGGNMQPRSVEPNLVAINADAVWASGYTGSGIIVGQLDTGANHAHNDLNDHLWSGVGYPNGGYDFENGDNDPSDNNGHGSLTAGFICGDGTNGDTTGVAPDATIMILRTNSNIDMHNAVDFALSGGSGAGQPADVLQSSVGFERDQFTTAANWENMKNEFRVDAIDVLAAGNCWTYAAGNGNSFVGGHYNVPDDIIVAANCPPPWLHPDQTLVGGKTAVIAVGATNNARSRTTWSSYGPAEWDNSSYADYPYAQPFNMGLLRPDIMVPGSNLTSLARIGQGYSLGNSGTSFSAPQLAGAVALMLSKDGSLTPARIDSILENTTRPVISSDPPGKDSLNGSGFLDIEAACLGIGNAQKAILLVINDSKSTANLIVNGMTHKQPWVVKVSPTSFTVAPGDTYPVDVWADTTGQSLTPGLHYDTLFITTNSESKTVTAVEVRLQMGPPTNIEMTSLTATGYVEKIALNWRTESEYNVEAWQIVRSEVADGDYTMIGMLAGNGTTSQPHSYSFTDSGVLGGKRYYYKLVSIDNMGTTIYGPVSAVAKAGHVISSLALSSNPAKNVGIRFNLSKNAMVSLKIYDITGRLVRTLVNGILNPDAYNIVWNGSNNNGKHTGCGVYFIKMDAAGEKSTLKVTLLK